MAEGLQSSRFALILVATMVDNLVVEIDWPGFNWHVLNERHLNT